MIVSSSASPLQHSLGMSRGAPSAAQDQRRPIEQDRIESLMDVVTANPGMVRRATQEDSDAMARIWLMMQMAQGGRLSEGPPDNAPENTYAQVKVNGKVVAILYNSGGAAMSNEAAAQIGKLDEPNLVGPDLARCRAETYAKALGGTVEMAATAKSQSEWQPRTNERPTFSRAELDQALAAIRQAAEQRHAAYRAALDVSA